MVSWLTKLGLRIDRRKKASGNSLALTIIELNEFTQILKEKGPDFADSLLEHVLQAVRANVRGSDIAKRYAREQGKIILLLPNTESSDLGAVVQRITDSLYKKQFKGHDLNVSFTVSFKEPGELSRHILNDFLPEKKLLANAIHSS